MERVDRSPMVLPCATATSTRRLAHSDPPDHPHRSGRPRSAGGDRRGHGRRRARLRPRAETRRLRAPGHPAPDRGPADLDHDLHRPAAARPRSEELRDLPPAWLGHGLRAPAEGRPGEPARAQRPRRHGARDRGRAAAAHPGRCPRCVRHPDAGSCASGARIPPSGVQGFVLSPYFHVLAEGARAAEALSPPNLLAEAESPRRSVPADSTRHWSPSSSTPRRPGSRACPACATAFVERALAPDLTYRRVGSVLRAAYDPAVLRHLRLRSRRRGPLLPPLRPARTVSATSRLARRAATAGSSTATWPSSGSGSAKPSRRSGPARSCSWSRPTAWSPCPCGGARWPASGGRPRDERNPCLGPGRIPDRGGRRHPPGSRARGRLGPGRRAHDPLPYPVCPWRGTWRDGCSPRCSTTISPAPIP